MNIRSYYTAPNISMFFIGLMMILPYLFPYHPNPIPTFYIEWLTAALALMAFSLLLKQTTWVTYKAPVVIWLPIAILGVMALQLLVLDIAYWQHYFLVAQYFIFAAMLIFLGSMLKDALGFDKTIRLIAVFLVISGLISTAIIFLDFANIRLGGWVYNNRGGGAVANVGQQNHLCSLLGLGLASLTFLYIKQRLASWQAWPMMLILLSGLALTASRSAWIFVGIIALAALAYRYLYFKTQQELASTTTRAKRLLFLLVLPALFYFVQLGLPHIPTSKSIITTNQRLVELAQTEDSVRMQLFKATWYIYVDNPFLGVGFGQMAGEDLNHADRMPSFQGAHGQAHNTVLQFMAETGTVGTLILLSFLLAFFLRVKSEPITPERWVWWLWIIIISIHSLLEYPLWYMHFLGLTSLLLGVGDIRTINIMRFRPQLLVAIFVMTWSASLLQTMHDYRIIQRWFYINQKVKLNHARFDEMYKQFKPIRTFSPLALYAETQLAATLPINRDGLEDKLAITQRLLKSYVSPSLAYNYATLLALDGRLEQAKTHLNHAYYRYPGAINQYWHRTVKLTLDGEPSLFRLVKHIEWLRDGDDPTYKAPIINYEQFKKPRVSLAPDAERV